MAASTQPNLRPTNSRDDSASLQLQAEQLALMCRHSRPAIISAAFVAWYVCWLLLSEYSVLDVGFWYASLVLVSGLRLGVQQSFLSAYQRDGLATDFKRHRFRALLGIALNGVVWGLPSTWLLLTDPTKQVMMTVFLVGLSAAGIGSLAPVRNAYTAFIAPFMLPIAVYFVFLGDDFVNVGVGVAVFAFAMMATAHRNTRTIGESLSLQLANAELAAREHREKAMIERANRDLESEIIQRERTEAELRVAKSDAETANRAKNQFLANMSHELRTPLNGVLGMSELLIRTLPNSGQAAKSHKYAETIRVAGERLLHLIDDILDMARIEAGAVRFENGIFDPRSVVADAVESVAEQCAEKRLTVRAEIGSDVPERVYGDIHRVRQVLINLVSNAVKFTEAGGITVKLIVTVLPGAASDSHVQLCWSVTDSGIGIAPHARGRLFQPFSQLDDSPTRRFGGTGLGLAICRQIVTALGGRIDVDSALGLGSTFWFEIPFEHAHREDKPAASTAGAVSLVLNGRILVVEDNETNSQLIVEMLELLGCTTRTAADGAEALNELAAERFDAVLMDWHMPKMDGLTATQIWRQRETTRFESTRLPIIALTASVLPGDRETCLAAGMDDFIPKPFTYDELATVVGRWLPERAPTAIETRATRQGTG